MLPRPRFAATLPARRPPSLSDLQLYVQAAAAEDSTAMAHLGHIYANGQGVPQDNATAVAWFKRAADQGACALLCCGCGPVTCSVGRAGRGNEPPQLQLRARQVRVGASRALSRPPSPPLLPLLLRCAAGHPSGMLALGYMHMTGAAGAGWTARAAGCLLRTLLTLPHGRVWLHRLPRCDPCKPLPSPRHSDPPPPPPLAAPPCPTGSHGLAKDYGAARKYLQEAISSGQGMGGGGPRQWSGLGDAFFYLGGLNTAS